ncbi:MAG TPA: sulfotransferase [Candidatus Limnocylindria bacterium]|nr:sulfotransferase [Candidatus Limnocylindria bacterium]
MSGDREVEAAGDIRPNFFIVGAPRCGTTALYAYLEQHPDVFMPYHKEPVFFGADLGKRPRSFDREAYLNLFKRGIGRKRRGEATVWYLYSQAAPEEIRAFSPDARIIIMLRNPVDMIYSLHSHQLFTADEEIEAFEEALAAESDRRAGRRIPATTTRPEGLLYRDCGRYASHVRRWLTAFGPDAVKVIIFDDFSADPAGVYRQTLEFLDLDSTFQPEFNVVNRNKGVRSQRLLALTSSPRFYAATRWLPGPLFHAFRRGLKRLNTRHRSRPPMDPELRRELTAEFAPDVEELGRVIGRDLSRWSAVAPPPAA